MKLFKRKNKSNDSSSSNKNNESKAKESSFYDENEQDFSFQYTPHDELYGQVIPKENPELISSKLKELDKELDNIGDKTAWIMALEQCPHMCDEKFKLMFLRCEIFNEVLAAKRIVKYWAKRVELFGEDKAYKPFVLGDDGPFAGDEKALQIGFMRLTHKRDDAGRPIIFVDPSRLPEDKSSYENESVCRSLWYNTHVLLDDETAQRKGAVIIAFPKNVKLHQFNRKLGKMNIESIKGCIPIRLSAIHICHPPAIFDIIFPIMKVLMGAHMRKKIKLNSGSDEFVIQKFETQFGIAKEKLPSEMGGELVLNHEQWLEERRRSSM